MKTTSERTIRMLAAFALGWLLILDVVGGAAPPPATSSTPVAETSDRDSPVARALRQGISLPRERHNLESVLALLSKKLDVPIEIIQPDRQAEGLTKGLALDLQADDKPAGQVLSGYLLALGHGRLTYVIKPKEQGGPDMIFVTTPAAIRERRDKWPPASIVLRKRCGDGSRCASRSSSIAFAQAWIISPPSSECRSIFRPSISNSAGRRRCSRWSARMSRGRSSRFCASC